MNAVNRRRAIYLVLSVSLLAACKPSSEPPPDLIKSQREAMSKAKALGGQIQKQTEDRMKEVDGPQR